MERKLLDCISVQLSTLFDRVDVVITIADDDQYHVRASGLQTTHGMDSGMSLKPIRRAFPSERDDDDPSGASAASSDETRPGKVSCHAMDAQPHREHVIDEDRVEAEGGEASTTPMVRVFWIRGKHTRHVVNSSFHRHDDPKLPNDISPA